VTLIDDPRPDHLDELKTHAEEVNPAALDAIPNRFADADIDHEGLLAWADEYAKTLIEAWPSNRPTTPCESLLIAGPVGVGKTHACFALIRRLAAKNVPVVFRYLKHADMASAARYRSGYTPREEHEHNTKVPLLILDDLGTVPDPDFVAARIIDARYDALRPTIFTSNFTAKELVELLGERSASRLAETCKVITLDGADRRRAE
jgi:DNA replication protein DnaC